MKKGVTFKWGLDCEEAFQDLKRYLMMPHVLIAQMLGRDLILYTKALDHSVGALLA